MLVVSSHALAGGIVVEGARSVPVPPNVPMAGYMIIVNESGQEDSVVGASASAADFGMVMVHESIEEDGVAKMRHIHAVPLPKGETVVFKPKGFHLMLMQPQHRFVEGDEFLITIQFGSGATQDVTFTVVSRDELGVTGGHSH